MLRFETENLKKNKIVGFELPKEYHDAALSALKAYPALKMSLKSMEEIDGIKKDFAEVVAKKCTVQSMINQLDEAFNSIPETYREVLKYYIFSADNKEQKKHIIENEFGKQIKEVENWLVKLIYFAAKYIGYPVSEICREYSFVLDEGGFIKIE